MLYDNMVYFYFLITWSIYVLISHIGGLKPALDIQKLVGALIPTLSLTAYVHSTTDISVLLNNWLGLLAAFLHHFYFEVKYFWLKIIF
jgi:hypothetical protein